MTITYAPGAAWCVANGEVVAVFDQALGAERAIELHSALAGVPRLTDALAILAEVSELLCAIGPEGSGVTSTRLRGVPASLANTGPMPEGEQQWSRAVVPTGIPMRFGQIGATVPFLPLHGGIVQVDCVAIVASESMSASAQASAHSAVHAAPPVSTPAFPHTPPSAPSLARTPASLAPPTGAVPAQFGTSPPGFVPPFRPEAAAEQLPPVAGSPIESSPFAPQGSSEVDEETILGSQLPGGPGNSGGPGNAGSPGSVANSGISSAPATLGAAQPVPVQSPAAQQVAAEQAYNAMPGESPLDGGNPATGPLVLSVLCPQRHVNPPRAEFCRVCEIPIESNTAGQRARPDFAQLRMPNGDAVLLGRSVVLGRRPRSRRIDNGRVPRLVAVVSPNEDISRSHVEIRCEEWNILVTDLASTNGTMLLREGYQPRRLMPDEATMALIGDRIDLGDGVVVRIEAV
ncbi:FHA domain-containing protein [Humidisolicoccus flavus]|uniref:FHA domain-containing protein n=1 Tax=Humidisolicoccus flavus TaxID=3111414 RepID=UPI00324921ED